MDALADPVHGRILVGKNFGKLFRQKPLMMKNLANNLQSVHVPNAFFGVSVNIGEENLVHSVVHNSPTLSPAKNFPSMVHKLATCYKAY